MPPLTSITTPFRVAMDNLLKTGVLIVNTQADLSALERHIAGRRDLHNAFHGEICERLLNSWECDAQNPIATGDELVQIMKENLVMQRKTFNASWTFIQSIMWGRKVDNSLILKGLTVAWDN
ncbi:hypothetical protein FBEOM_79 [Fusarium beomiforme]|uniref:Uncharacterized protein n=1 Tax=Fusarium beomiforme TaxID=44412 RepID=A0A9P5B125_9HYPO|nr:hypothetical protein FBEOM_79 [Fusarium beomiforme]